MTHRLMILGTLFEFVELTKAARARGYYTVVCDGNPDGPARAYADQAYIIDVRDTEAIAQVCKDERIDRIITSFSDLLFECMVQIADAAGIPCYVDIDSLDLYREKTKTKALCQRLGIGVPRFCMLGSDFTDTQIEDFRFPCILKPVDSYGSRGLTVVQDAAQVRQAFDEAAQYTIRAGGGDKALLEEISPGQEFNCMAFVADGQVYMLSVADRMTASFDETHIPILYALHYPGRYARETLPAVRDLLQKFVNETGQKWGPISTQCFYDPQTGRIEVCEIAGRMFGFEHRLLTLFSGLDVASLLLDLSYDREALRRTLAAHDPMGFRSVTGLYVNSSREGILYEQEAMEALCGHEACVDHVLFYQSGEQVGVLGPKPYFARYYLVAETAEKLAQAEAAFWEKVRATDTEGKDLIFHPQARSDT